MSVAMAAIDAVGFEGLLDRASALVSLAPFLYSTVKLNCCKVTVSK